MPPRPLPAAMGTGGRIVPPRFFYVFFFFLRPAVDASPYVYDHAECMAAKRERKKKSERNGDNSPVISVKH